VIGMQDSLKWVLTSDHLYVKMHQRGGGLQLHQRYIKL